MKRISDTVRALAAPRTFQLCLVLLLLLVAGSCGEQRRERFRSGSEALNSDAAQRGWIPVWLPPEATDVDIRYDLDTNYRWLNFHVRPAVAAALQRQLRAMSEEQIRDIELRRPRGFGAWPEGVIQQPPANDGALHSRIFCGSGKTIVGQACFAFEHGSTSVYVWIPHEQP